MEKNRWRGNNIDLTSNEAGINGLLNRAIDKDDLEKPKAFVMLKNGLKLGRRNPEVCGRPFRVALNFFKRCKKAKRNH